MSEGILVYKIIHEKKSFYAQKWRVGGSGKVSNTRNRKGKEKESR